MNTRRSKKFGIAVGVASAAGIATVNDRLEIIFFAPTAGRYSVAFGEDAVLDNGVTMRAGDPPLKLDREEMGDELTATVNFICDAPLTAPVLTVAGPCRRCREERVQYREED